MANTSTALPPELASLHDIHLPTRVSAWIVAPGWYIVGAGLLLLGIIVAYIILRQQKIHKARRQGLLLLRQLQASQVMQAQIVSADVSNILRRVALEYYPRSQIAGLHGQEWLMFLNNTSRKLDFNNVQYELLELPYQEQINQVVDLEPLFTIARAWILQRRKACLS